MDNELHAARLVEEALEHQRFLRRQGAERGMGGGEIGGQFFGADGAEADLAFEPAPHRGAGLIFC